MVIPRSIGSLVMQPESAGIRDNPHNRVATRRIAGDLRLTRRAPNCPNIILPLDTRAPIPKFASLAAQVTLMQSTRYATNRRAGQQAFRPARKTPSAAYQLGPARPINYPTESGVTHCWIACLPVENASNRNSFLGAAEAISEPIRLWYGPVID